MPYKQFRFTLVLQYQKPLNKGNDSRVKLQLRIYDFDLIYMYGTFTMSGIILKWTY